MRINLTLVIACFLINSLYSFRNFYNFKDRDDSILFSSYASSVLSKRGLTLNSYLSKSEIEELVLNLILEGEIMEDLQFRKTMENLVAYLFKDGESNMKILDIEKYYTPSRINKGLTEVIKPYSNDL